MARLNSRLLKSLFLAALILTSLTASILLAAIPVLAALSPQQPVSGPLPAGVTVDTTFSTTGYISFIPNRTGVGQTFLVNIWVTPEPGPDRVFQGLTVTLTKPDGTRTNVGPLNSYAGNGTAWFQYTPDQVGTWRLKLDFAGMYYPAGRYYNGQIITNSSGGTLYPTSAYYRPASTSEQSLTVQTEQVWPGALGISPPSGPGGAMVQFSGSGYPANSGVAVSYYDQAISSWKYWNTVTTNSSGAFTFLSEMPDLRRSLSMSDQTESYATLSFRTELASLVYGTADYKQYLRGLSRVGNQSASGLFGNGTSLYSVSVQAGDVLTLSGKWFHPGVVYVRWDGVAVVGTVTGNEWRSASVIGTSVVDSQGYFEASATIPRSSVGQHYLAIEDSQTTFIAQVTVVSPSSLQISPSSGPGGVIVQFTGSGYPASAPVVISYQDQSSGTWRFMANITANDEGRINLNVEIPDLQKSAGTGDWPASSYNSLAFMATCQGIVYSYAQYNEYTRGLTQIGNLTPTGLYGNGTNLATYYGNGTSAQMKSFDVIPISGKWFHPNDIVYIRWDGVAVVGTVTGNEWRNAVILNSAIADASGSFSTSITIPNANPGEHYIAVEDSQAKVIVKVLLSPGSLQISPSSGPGGANVQFTGSGYPALGRVNFSYLDPYDGMWKFWTSTTADSRGGIALTFEVPDSRRSLSSGDWTESYGSYVYRTEVNGAIYSYASYNQYWRGLKTVGNQIASGLFGDGTNFAQILTVRPSESLTLSGRWFHPGVIYIRWDGTAVVGTVTADQWRTAAIIGTTIASASGSFEISVTIPNAVNGEHFIAIEDSQTTLKIKVNVGLPYSPPPPPTPPPTPEPTLPTPKISVFCSSETTSSGFRVEIQGNVTSDGVAIASQPVFIQYSVTAGTSWQDLTQVLSGSNGRFLAVWTPSVTGTYMVRARIDATSVMNGASATTSLALTPASGDKVFSVNSNSTISAFVFNSTSGELSFTVDGTSGSSGYVSVKIPKTLIADISGLDVRLDGNPVAFSVDSTADSWIISINYSHSIHTVVIELPSSTSIPEMPEWTPHLTFMAVVVLTTAASAGVVIKKNRNKSA